MLNMDYEILIGGRRLGLLDSVTIRRSVESLCDTATIVVPATYLNRTLNLEQYLQEGETVSIDLGYNGNLQTEFEGYLQAVHTDDKSITIECEDSLYLFRKEVGNKEYKNITVKSLLQQIVQQVDGSFTVKCDYEFTYDKFVCKDATAYDVLKKLQDETKANIYFSGTTLHVHPQYSKIGNTQPVKYDFAVNIEKSELKYKKDDERKYFIEVEGIKSDGTRVTVTTGKQGGDKRCIKVYGVTDRASLLKRAQEELQTVVYTGFEGSFTGWLVPYCEPTFRIELNDEDYPEKKGQYYVIATETTFSSSGGQRKITIGKKIGK